MVKAAFSTFAVSLAALALVVGTHQAPPPEPDPDPVPAYDYSQPVPAGEQKGDDWFDNSAIIGHSLMEGFKDCSGVDSNIHYFTSTGISAAGVINHSRFKLPNGGTGTLKTGLAQRQFSKVYIMLGINEVAISKDSFKASMSTIIQYVRDSQPEGIPIYILNITPTTQNKSSSSDFNRKNIRRLNEALAELCQEKECYLVDLYACFADGNGYLPANKSTDGVHLNASQYPVMANYILSHTVDEG